MNLVSRDKSLITCVLVALLSQPILPVIFDSGRLKKGNAIL